MLYLYTCSINCSKSRPLYKLTDQTQHCCYLIIYCYHRHMYTSALDCVRSTDWQFVVLYTCSSKKKFLLNFHQVDGKTLISTEFQWRHDFMLSTGRNKPALPPLWTLDPPRHPPASCGVGARTGTPVFDPSVGQKSVTLRLLANFPNTTCIYNYSQANVFRKIYHFGRSYI